MIPFGGLGLLHVNLTLVLVKSVKCKSSGAVGTAVTYCSYKHHYMRTNKLPFFDVVISIALDRSPITSCPLKVPTAAT